MILALLLAVAAPPELRLEVVRESLTGIHCRYRLYDRGLPSDEVIVRPCAPAHVAPLAMEGAPVAAQDRIVNGRRVRRTIVFESPLQPWAEDVDAVTGELVRRLPLFHRATKPALVFDPNPVASLDAPWLQDQNDSAAAVPAAAYREVLLQDVAESGPLRGPYVTLVDRQAPAVAPPDAARSLLFNREQDGFEDVQAYFHIDRNQRYIQSLGFTGSRAIVPYSIEVDAHGASGNDTSTFIPSLVQVGRGTLYFGEGGTDDAEDADILVHEYGHAILEWIAPGAFGGAFASESRALSEGFGDYWAYSAHSAVRRASGRDPYCFADWDARCWEDLPAANCAYPPGTNCLRRLDDPRTMAQYDRVSRPGVEHLNGAIWASALREIHDAIGRRAADMIILESLFDAPAQVRFADLARSMLQADELLFGGAHRDVICAAMTSRLILTECGMEPRGEFTLYQSVVHGQPIEDARTNVYPLEVSDPRLIERVLVRVDLEHSSRGDLRLELVAPDGTVVVLQTITIDRGTELHVTYGLTATPVESLDVLRGRSAAGTWQLRIIDQRAFDTGTLHSWGLLLELAGDERVETRPRGEKTQMIPVVAHLHGANDTTFRSDLRLANPRSVATDATLIFTPSGADGTTTFSAIDVALQPGQTIAFDDVVESAFGATGSGSLEIVGDVLAMSRTYTTYAGGTVGQQVPPVEQVSGSAPLFASTVDDPNTRVNLGITELSGRTAEVLIGDERVTILPYSHLQFPVAHGHYTLTAAEGARVAMYLSQVENTTGDAMFIPAQSRRDADVIAPAISGSGADRVWRSDLWFGPGGSGAFPVTMIRNGAAEELLLSASENPRTIHDVLQALFGRGPSLAALRVGVCCDMFAGTRVATDGTSQYVPLQDVHGPIDQHLLFIRTAGPYRTNAGIVSDEAVTARFTTVDAAGNLVDERTLSIDAGVLQIPLPAGLSSGRVHVRFLSGRGRAYASLIDGRTGDATFVPGQ